MTDCQTLIIGAGPVGLTLAIDLAQRGIKVILAEKNLAPLKWPKMERCNARSMEIFRRLGLSETIRAASRFRDVPMDVFVVSSFSAPPLVHLRYPSVTEAQAIIARSTDGTLPREPYQLISQYTLEPLLKGIAEKMDGIRVLSGHELKSFDQDAASVTAVLEGVDGERKTIRADYMVGCDGGTSTVRKQLGIRFEGEGQILKLRQILFRSEKLFEAIPCGQGRHYYFPHATLVVQDDLKHFAMHFTRITEASAQDEVKACLGLDTDIEILNETIWNQNLLLAEEYYRGRIFLAGDALHIVIPNGGLGLNTGIGDAADLSWKVWATLQGWGGPRLLSSYQAERRPIGIRNRDASGRAARDVLKWRLLCDADIEADTPAARVKRKLVEQAAYEGQKNSQGLDGVELGYRYMGSPIICEEPGSGPRLNDVVYTPTTSPGARLPHMWLQDGRSVLDVMGPGYNLINLGADEKETHSLALAMAKLGVPLMLHRFHEPNMLRVYERRLLVVRPDLHVAWRGDRAPADAAAVAARITGHL